MIDQYQRTIDYLRLSVTDRCNMNCCYCRPEGECFRGQEGSRLLSLEELYQLCEIFSELGITKIKVTGGEPFLRPGILFAAAAFEETSGVVKCHPHHQWPDALGYSRGTGKDGH